MTRALRLCTWCGHPNHDKDCPQTVRLQTVSGGALRRLIGDANRTAPCPCAKPPVT